MANPLPVSKAYDKLRNDAVADYLSKLYKFNAARKADKRAAWLAVQKAYGELSAAHWELQQAFAAQDNK